MKILICFISLFGVCYCSGDIKVSENYRHEYIDDGYRNDGRYYGYRDHSDRSRSIHPCNVHDTYCVQRVCALSSRVSPINGPPPNVISLKSLPLDIPSANLSIILDNAKVEGLRHWKIKEFYINKVTDVLVLEVLFDRIVVSSPTAIVRFYRKGREPVETKDTSTIEYKDVSLTLTVPSTKGQREDSNVYTYLPDRAPKYRFGPGIYSSHDPEIIAAQAELGRNVDIAIREVFLTQGPLIISVFLETNLCNYGHH